MSDYEINASKRDGGGFVVTAVRFYSHDLDTVKNSESYSISEEQARRLFGKLGREIQQ